MKKKNKVNLIVAAFIVIAIIALIGFYIYDIVCNGTPITENLFRALAVVFALLGTFIRVLNGCGRKGLDFYEKSYKDELGQAFVGKEFMRKKLLCAVRLYNENHFEKALKYLSQLANEAEHHRDLSAVLFFSALCYTDMGLEDCAINEYYKLLRVDCRNSTAHSNLGLLLVKSGSYDDALNHFEEAISIDSENYYAYLNKASCLFRKGEYDKAIDSAKTALEKKNNGMEAASLLTIIYALLGDEENRKKYFHISITNGERPEELNQAIQFYKKAIESYEE